jgi:hypothetical protein
MESCSKEVVGMEIVIGKLFVNRTAKYLIPALNYYGPTLKTKLNLIFKLAVGIHDKLLDGSYLEGQKNIFILADKSVRPDLFQNFKDWIQHQEYYVTDYVHNSVQKDDSRFHMFVIAFPPSLDDAYDKFKKGKYSKMYTKSEIDEFFSEDSKIGARSVLCRWPYAKLAFKQKIKQEFNVLLQEEDFKTEVFEYDLPPKKEEEIFNF